MILHIPHSSRELGNYVKLTNEQGNLDYLTDTDVDELFWYEYCDIIKFSLSRFVCDVERLEEHNEPMEAKGQGIIYRKDVYGNDIIRHISDEDVYEMYNEHHRKLRLLVNKQLAYYENVVIVDCHTFTPNSSNGGDPNPDICIGTDFQHTPLKLIKIVKGIFENRDLNVSIDSPYEGTIIPQSHIGNNNVKSIMIEVNKNVYTNNMSNAKLIINEVLDGIHEYSWSIA